MKISNNIRIEMQISGMQITELHKKLTKHCSNFIASSEIKLISPKSRYRSIDPTVLVAIVSASGAALGSLISGLISVVKLLKTGKIEIHGRDGKKLIVPANMPLEKIDELIERINKIDNPKVYLK